MNLAVLAILACVSVYTASYGVWTWKKKNRLGAVMIFIVALTVITLPLYAIYIRFK